jgi:hypothetical protein
MTPDNKMAAAPPDVDWDSKHLQEKIKVWTELRSAIMHEDNLVNHRFSWLLTFEGFLMAGFFLVQSAIAANKMSPAAIVGVETFLVFILLASLWVCYISGQTISAAYRQVSSIQQAWKRMFPEEAWEACVIPPWFLPWRAKSPSDSLDVAPSGSLFPPIRGEFTYKEVSRTQRIPFILFSINLLAIVMCFLIAFVAWKHPAALYLQSHQ